MSLLTDIGLVVLGFFLGLILVSASITGQIKRKQIVFLYPKELGHYDVILGGIGNRGRLLWKNPKFKLPDEPEDMDLDNWR